MKHGLLARSLLVVFILGGLAIVVHAVKSANAASGVMVDGAYALADGKSPQLGYVYLTITVPSGDVDTLLGATSPIATNVTLGVPGHHAPSTVADDAATLPVTGHQPLVLQPRGAHFILKGLSHPLRPGQKIPLTLVFQRASPVDLFVDVLTRPPAAGAPRLPQGVKID